MYKVSWYTLESKSPYFKVLLEKTCDEPLPPLLCWLLWNKLKEKLEKKQSTIIIIIIIINCIIIHFYYYYYYYDYYYYILRLENDKKSSIRS